MPEIVRANVAHQGGLHFGPIRRYGWEWFPRVAVGTVRWPLVDAQAALPPCAEAAPNAESSAYPRFGGNTKLIRPRAKYRAQRFVVLLIDVGVEIAHVGIAVDSSELSSNIRGSSNWQRSGSEQPPRELIGRILSILLIDLHVVDDKLTFTDRGERGEVETILADHRNQLTEYDKRLGETDPATMRDYYQQRRKDIEAAIARETALLQSIPAVITGSWFENRIIPLDATTPDQPGVAILVDAYNRESEKRAAAGKPAGLGAATPHPPKRDAEAAAPAGGGYTGTAVCGGCHAPALAFWKTTKHARALSALERVGRDKDPTCVGCHVTGYLQPGALANFATVIEAARRRGETAAST